MRDGNADGHCRARISYVTFLLCTYRIDSNFVVLFPWNSRQAPPTAQGAETSSEQAVEQVPVMRKFPRDRMAPIVSHVGSSGGP